MLGQPDLGAVEPTDRALEAKELGVEYFLDKSADFDRLIGILAEINQQRAS